MRIDRPSHLVRSAGGAFLRLGRALDIASDPQVRARLETMKPTLISAGELAREVRAELERIPRGETPAQQAASALSRIRCLPAFWPSCLPA